MKSTTLKAIAVTFTLVSVTACQSTTVSATSQGTYQACENITSVNLNTATRTAKISLQTGQCSHKFDDYYQDLLTVAKGSPDQTNKKAFDEFISWSFNQQIINKRDAKHYFNRYFGERFISLDNTYNTCSQSAKQNEIFTALALEMQDKKLGLLQVLGDKRIFNQVSRQHRDLQTVLEATWMACEA